MPDIIPTSMLKSLRTKLDSLGPDGNKMLFTKAKGSKAAPVLGGLALMWLVNKTLLEKSRKEYQGFIDSSWNTQGANLRALE